jgi:hypothetical protein
MYLKANPGKAVFLKFISCPLIHLHAHSTPHNFVCSQETLHNSGMLSPRPKRAKDHNNSHTDKTTQIEKTSIQP